MANSKGFNQLILEELNEETTVVNIRKGNLVKQGYKDFEDWSSKSNNLYIGRNMTFYVKGTNKSKWPNPYSVKKYGRDKCSEMYRKYILESKDLLNSLEELRSKNLGCWCCPDKCHGDILIELLEKK